MEGREFRERDRWDKLSCHSERAIPEKRSVFAELQKQFERHTVKQLSKENTSSNGSLSANLNCRSWSPSSSISFEVVSDSNSARNWTEEKCHPLMSQSSYNTSSNSSTIHSIDDALEIEQWEYLRHNKQSISEYQQKESDMSKEHFGYCPKEHCRCTKTVQPSTVDVENYHYLENQVRTPQGNWWNIFNKKKNYQSQDEAENHLPNCQELFSDDRKQYVKIEKKLGKLHYSGNLLLNFSDVYCQLCFGTLGTESFLVVNCADSKNCDEFVSRIEFSEREELNYSLPFQYNKRKLLDMISITKIYEDRLLCKRNEAYDSLVQTLKERSKKISDDFGCREDFLQLLMIVRSPNLALNRPLILLKEIIQNEYMSREVIESAEHLRDMECNFSIRNKEFPKFNVSTEMPDIFDRLRNICVEGIHIHRRNLINECPNKSFKLVCLIVNVNSLLDKRVLFISKQDIKLFADLLELLNEKHEDENVPNNFVKKLWNKFFRRIETEDQSKSLKKLGPITHPIYYFLIKSLYEIVSDICSKNGNQVDSLISFEEGELLTTESVTWSGDDPFNKSLEQQYNLLCKLVKHFEPGVYSYQSSYDYVFKLLKGSEDVSLFDIIRSMSKERLVWLYMVDSGLAPVLCHNSSSHFKELSQPILNAFVKFIQEVKEERHETCRAATHNIVKFVTRISPYICTIYSVLTSIDYNILNKQIEVISGTLIGDNSRDAVTDHFSTLLTIYNEYWEHRDSIVGKLPIPCSIFNPDVELVMHSFLEIVKNAFLKNIEVTGRIKFLRLYNEFLKHLQGIDFTWFISECSYFPELDGIVEKITKSDVTSYRVIEPEDFVEVLTVNEKPVPKHFLLETFKKLLEVVNMSLDKNGWKDEDCVEAAGDLLLAIGHSFNHFEDQTDYRDFEHFLRDCTMPFYCVIENSNTYSDFKRRLDNVEKFYAYVRKQNQIGVKQALDLCEQEIREADKNGFDIKIGRTVLEGFDTKIGRTVLEECYDRYSKKLFLLQGLEIEEILKEMENELNKVEKLPLDKWTTDFKRNFLPVLLAYVAAIWSLLESKDVVAIKKKIEPHCVQILCVFRLLGVDQATTGVPKHFSQVLTGQGKSLILALISALIALTKNHAFVMCYSYYLASRDKTYFKPFFSSFSEFDIKSKINYNTVDAIAGKILSCDCNGTEVSLRSVVQRLVLDQLQERIITTNCNYENSILLIDEADVFFSENFCSKASLPVVHVPVPALLKIQPKIWDIVKDGVSERSSILEQIREFISELLKDENYHDFRNLMDTSSDLFEKALDIMVEDAIYVSKTDNANHLNQNYKIDQDGIICLKDQFSIYKSTLYADYQNTFNYFRLQKDNYDNKNYRNFGYLEIKIGHISYESLLSRYPNILGVSGTLLNLNDYEKNALKRYGIQTISAMPSFFGKRKLVFDPSEQVSIPNTKAIWLSNIFKSISKNIHLNRAVLVFFEAETEMELFREKYQSSIDRLYTLTGNEDPKTLEWRINEAGVAQTVTLATRTMGRGIDYKSNDQSVEANGGVHVIQTFFSLDEKEEIQIKGRTARKNNKGSYELILDRLRLSQIYDAVSYDDDFDFDSLLPYVELCDFRRRYAASREEEVETARKATEVKHNLTMQFLDSLAMYDPKNRNEYLSKLIL